jgi:hypothetical protein
MAKAPTAAQAQRALRGQPKKPGRRVTMTIEGRTLVLDFRTLGPADDAISRAQTGVPISGIEMNIAAGKYLMGGDTLLIMWWMARRKAGEHNLSFAEVCAQYPTYDVLDNAAVTYDLVGEDDDDPEA